MFQCDWQRGLTSQVRFEQIREVQSRFSLDEQRAVSESGAAALDNPRRLNIVNPSPRRRPQDALRRTSVPLRLLWAWSSADNLSLVPIDDTARGTAGGSVVMSSLDLAALIGYQRQTSTWAATLLRALARDELTGRRPVHLTEPRLATCTRFRGSATPVPRAAFARPGKHEFLDNLDWREQGSVEPATRIKGDR